MFRAVFAQDRKEKIDFVAATAVGAIAEIKNRIRPRQRHSIEHVAQLVLGQMLLRGRSHRNVGDRIGLQPCTRGEAAREVCVRALTDTRGPATVARSLYEETPQSIAAREAATRARPYVADPALAIEQGRPTKRDRRELVAWQRGGASIDE